MKENDFKNNFIKALQELSRKYAIDEDLLVESEIMINPVYEPKKNSNSTDDCVRLILLSEKNTAGRLFTIDSFITLVSGFAPLFPNWINVSLVTQDNKGYIINLDVSLRFRKPSELHNKETGHPPFKAIYN